MISASIKRSARTSVIPILIRLGPIPSIKHTADNYSPVVEVACAGCVDAADAMSGHQARARFGERADTVSWYQHQNPKSII